MKRPVDPPSGRLAGVRRGLAAVALLLLLFIAVTAWALESGGVAVLETRTSEGDARETHVWYVEPDGELFLEAGTPENGWYRDVLEDPVVRFSADGRSESYRALPLEGERAHAEIRARLRAKYGLRDVWVGMLVDTRHSVAVRLVPLR